MCIRDRMWAREIIAGSLDGEAAGKALAGARLLSRYQPINTYAPKREIAAAVYENKGYFL